MVPAPILSCDTLAAWRAAATPTGRPLALVMGSFELLHPGNLAALRAAGRAAAVVCAAVEPECESYAQAYGLAPPNVRAEILSHVRDVAAAVVLDPEGRALEQLRPYWLAGGAQPQATGALRRQARAGAERVIELPPIPLCRARAIAEAIQTERTPLAIPPTCCAPIPSREALEHCLATVRNNRQTLVTVNGCFDLLHIGHLRLLAYARGLGDALMVLVNDDASVRAYKGPTRPIFPIHARLQALQALRAVTLAVPFAGDHPLPLLEAIRPAIHVKGGSFEEARVRAERELLARWGGRIETHPLIAGYSTTHVVDRLAPSPASARMR